MLPKGACRGVVGRWLLASVAVVALTAHSAAPAWAESRVAASGSLENVAVDSDLLPPPPTAAVETHAPRAAPSTPAFKAQADVAPQPPQDAHRFGGKEWWLEKRAVLGDAPDMVRYVANECILAGVAGAAIAVALTVSGGAVGPVASAALGVSPEMSTFGITALGCVAGASAGVASAVAIYAWDEPETIRDFAIEQAANVRYAAGATADVVMAVARAPQDAIYAAAAGAWSVAAATASGAQWVAASAASGVGYVAAAAVGGAQTAAGAVVTAAWNGVGSLWQGGGYPQPAPEAAFDVASVPQAAALARVY